MSPIRSWFPALFLLMFSCYTAATTSVLHDAGYIDVDHGKLFYERFGVGVPIVVLHGGPGMDHQYFLPQLLTLADDHEVIFYDQRGSGQSLETPFNPTYINMSRFVEDLEALRSQLGLDTFVLMGHSFGGLLAMNYAIAHPEHLSGMILMNTDTADDKGHSAFLTELQKRIEPIQEDIKPLFDAAAFNQLTAKEILNIYQTIFKVYFYDPKNVALLNVVVTDANILSVKKGSDVRSLMNPYYQNFTLFEALSHLKVPTLIIHSDTDPIPLWTVEAIHQAIPDAQMRILTACGHFAFIEKPSETFNAIESFIKNHQNK